MKWSYRSSVLFVLATVITGLCGFPSTLNYLIPDYNVASLSRYSNDIPQLAVTEFKENYSTSTLFITGDVLLARHVETLIEKRGFDYPYKELGFFKTSPAYVLVNFESAISLIHKKTPDFNMKFSTDENSIPALREAGVTHVGIANNHSLDSGEKDFNYMKSVFADNQIVSIGNPNIIDDSASSIINLADKKIGILAIYALYGVSDKENLRKAMEKLSRVTDLQIVYVHWGDEYQSEPNKNQIELASTLVKFGADLVVGHHPHVIQNIELVNGVRVFYSLGNLIFDQYFSDEVQDGLILKLTVDKEGLTVSPLLMTSKTSHTVPRLMSDKEIQKFTKSSGHYSRTMNISGLLKNGLKIAWPLASSAEMAIMTQ